VSRTFVGFGFGAIQAGLFLYEAQASGNFDRLVVVEVAPEIVAAVRRAGGVYAVNIAHADGVETAFVGPLEIYDPAQPEDREGVVAAIAAASEIATAVPSVNAYASDAPGSIHRLLAAGLLGKTRQGGPACVVYAAENHNHAAELLTGHVQSALAPDDWQQVTDRVRFLNTVISKMSGVTLAQNGLAPVTPGSDRAFLVEDFNRILISAISLPAAQPPFQRGIQVFEEKPDLLPFEEAKLYCHNALHAMAGYLAAYVGLPLMADLGRRPDIIEFVRRAMLDEVGDALIARYVGVDALFTPAGFAAYTDDLLTRMVNPYLADQVERVARDPARKLGWEDRLVGAMRLSLSAGTFPRRLGVGAAAAYTRLDPTAEEIAPQRLTSLWLASRPPADEAAEILHWIAQGWRALRSWRALGFPDLA
jgi:mannitol-1-phosphate 5-dehydrogenase